MKGPSNSLFLPTSKHEIQVPESRVLSAEECKDIKLFLDKAKSPSMAAKETSMRGSKLLIPVTSKALFEGTLEPLLTPDSSGDEQFVVHVGSGKLEEMSREKALRHFSARLDESMDIGMKAGKNDVANTPLLDAKTQEPSEKKEANKIIKSALKSKSSLPQNATSDDDGLPLMEIREEWDETNTGLIRSEIVNISKQVERLKAGLKQSTSGGETSDSGKQFGELLVDLLKDGDNEIQTNFTHDASCDTSKSPDNATSKSETKTTSPSPKVKVSNEEYKAIYSRLEELEKLEQAEVANNTKIGSGQIRSSKSLQSKGWSKGFLNAKPKSKHPTKHRSNNSKPEASKATNDDSNVSINTKSEAEKVTNDVKMPMKTAAAKGHEEAEPKATKVSFSKDVNVKEISPRAAAAAASNLLWEPNYFPGERDADPFPPVATAPFEENVFRGVVKERVSSNPVPEKDRNRDEKRLSRFAMQRLQKG